MFYHDRDGSVSVSKLMFLLDNLPIGIGDHMLCQGFFTARFARSPYPPDSFPLRDRPNSCGNIWAGIVSNEKADPALTGPARSWFKPKGDFGSSTRGRL